MDHVGGGQRDADGLADRYADLVGAFKSSPVRVRVDRAPPPALADDGDAKAVRTAYACRRQPHERERVAEQQRQRDDRKNEAGADHQLVAAEPAPPFLAPEHRQRRERQHDEENRRTRCRHAPEEKAHPLRLQPGRSERGLAPGASRRNEQRGRGREGACPARRVHRAASGIAPAADPAIPRGDADSRYRATASISSSPSRRAMAAMIAPCAVASRSPRFQSRSCWLR